MSLICENIVKTYGGKDVLQSVSLELAENKIYGLIGRNGAGKTTLLSILTAQNPATKGTVTLDGMPVWENRRALEKLCFSRELNASVESGLASMKAKEYLRIAATYCENWDHNMEKRLLDLFELNVKKKLGKLSKGMLSMITIVISTHIIEEAANVLEDVIILHKGQVLVEENTQSFTGRARYVSGKAEDVDAAVKGLEVHHTDTVGRSKGATVFLKPGQNVDESCDVSVQPVSLQQAFVALCGEEARK